MCVIMWVLAVFPFKCLVIIVGVPIIYKVELDSYIIYTSGIWSRWFYVSIADLK